MSDSVLYNISTDQEYFEVPYLNKTIMQINDTNNGSYSGQINIDTTSVANSGRYVNWKTAYEVIPFCFSIKGDQSIVDRYVNNFTVGLKNGTHQLIDSIQVDYNQVSILQPVRFINHYISYKINTTWTEEDMLKYGDDIMFHKDSSNTFHYNGTATGNQGGLDGNGISNNRIVNVNHNKIVGGANLGQNSNEGLRRRCELVKNFTNGNTNDLNSLYNLNNATRELVNYIYDDNAAGADRTYYMVIYCKIKLAFVADFFKQMPLHRGGQVRIRIQYNQANCTINYVHTTDTNDLASDTLICSSHTILSGSSMPFMVASGNRDQYAINPAMLIDGNKYLVAGAGNNAADVYVPKYECVASYLNPNSYLYAGALDSPAGGKTLNLTIKTAIGKIGNFTPEISNCRLYVETYQFQNNYEENYLSDRIRKVQYVDVEQYFIENISAGASFQRLLSSTVVNPINVIVIPYYARNGAATGSTLTNAPTYESPFTTEPATSSPLASLTDFQILVSGVNVFNQQQTYTFENFMSEFSKTGGADGGFGLSGLSAGLISEKDWINGYRYYTANISRRLPADVLLNRSIQINGRNNTQVACNYMVFVEILRTVELDVLDGTILSKS